MIIQYKDLTGLQRKVVMVDGCFDPLHHGHIEYFKFAVSFRLPVLCNVENDRYMREVKKRPPLLTFKERAIVIDSIRYISYTHLQVTTTDDVLRLLQPAIYVKGSDWKNKSLPKEEKDICRKFKIKIEFAPSVTSSTKIVKRFLDEYSKNFTKRK